MNETGKQTRLVDQYSWILTLLAYLAVCLLIDSPFLFFHRSFYLGDWTHAIEPVLRYVRDMYVQHGRIVNWIPAVLCGAPTIQIAWPFHYIPGWFYLLFPFEVATGLFLLFHQLIAGMSGYWWHFLKNSDSISRRSESFLFGFLFMLSGYMMGSTTTTAIAATTSWIPVNLLLIDQIIKRPRIWCLGAFSLTLGLQISAGRPGLIAASFLLYATYASFSWFLLVKDRTTVLKSFLSFLAMGFSLALAVAFAAHVVLPLFEMVYEAPNVQMFNVMNTMRWSAGWFDFLGVLLMKPFEVVRFHLYPTYPDEFPYVTSLYLGAPVLSLSLFGFADRTWKYRWFWAAWAGLGLLLAAGEFSFLYPLLLNLSRDLSLFRFPIKLAIFMILPLSLAAVHGWRYISSGRAGRPYLWLLSVVWAFLFILGGILFMLNDEPWSQILNGLGIASRAFAIHSVGGVSLTPAQFHNLSVQELEWTRRLPVEMMIAGLAGFIPCVLTGIYSALWKGKFIFNLVWLLPACFLLVVNGTVHLWDTVDVSFFKHDSEIAKRLIVRSEEKKSDFRVLTAYRESIFLIPPVLNHPSDNPAREYWQYVRNILTSNCNIDFGIRLTNGRSVTPSWNMFYYVLGPLHSSCLVDTPSATGVKSDLPLYRWCQATSTRFLTSYMYTLDYASHQLKPMKKLNPELFNCIFEDESLNLRIYEITDICPRFSLHSKYRLVLKRVDALKLMGKPTESGYDPKDEVLVSARFPEYEHQLKSELNRSSAYPHDQKEEPGTIRLIKETPDTLELNVKTDKPAFLVVRDSFYNGWIARDNRRPTRIHIADGLFRTVFLDAGEHNIKFEFRPASTELGGIVSLLSFFSIMCLFATGLIPRLR